jgi:S1-C subfamily serine protease
MAHSSLTDFSNQLADIVARIAPSVVQVQGRRQPASGVVYDTDIVITTTRAIGHDEGLHVRTPDGRTLPADLIGWDPATHLVALRAAGLEVPALTRATTPPRVGHLALGVARSWSNTVTASAGIVSIIGGPLPTGRGRSIEEIIRTSAPMHRGFAGGAFVSTDGGLWGIATAAEIRGLGVVIPAAIAWKTVSGLLEHGRARRGYLGVAGQKVHLAEAQRDSAGGAAEGVLVIQVMEGSPAERAGLMVGDILVALDDVALGLPERLLETLAGRGGQTATLRIVRGAATSEIRLEIGEK